MILVFYNDFDNIYNDFGNISNGLGDFYNDFGNIYNYFDIDVYNYIKIYLIISKIISR